MQEIREHGVVIVGGGLVGSLVSIFLARRGLDVVVYERRADLRRTSGSAGRSINLVLTSRGIRALEKVGLREAALRMTVPVLGRMMHSIEGQLHFQPYGRDDSECNYSISRGELNGFLMTEAEKRGVRFHFESSLVRADLESSTLEFHDEARATRFAVSAPVVVGADGAASAVRAELMKLPGFEESSELLDHGYKELTIPAGKSEAFRIERNALHIWPRGSSMLMALPNVDGSFTVTLYLPHAGPDGFDEIVTPRDVLALFQREFPDSIPLIPDLTADYLANPTGNLGTVRCYPWHHRDKCVLLGDASHAIVPFFGQGMNSGFEDCTRLDELMDRHGDDDWGTVFAEFGKSRKPDAEAIADMALENFIEMRDKVGDERFLLRKAVEHRLERELPAEYRSRYSMVMYSGIPYRDAFDAGRIQDEILTELCAGLESPEDLDLERAARLVRRKLTPFVTERRIRLNY